jgi:5'-nucleotidase
MIKRILITGDDGYNSVGIRTLARLFKDRYDVQIAATLNQQSATGGKMSLTNDLAWGEEEIEGVPALWVDGSPVDAIEIAKAYYKKPFDLAISGINFGENISYSLVSSGTFSAAVRSIGVKLAPKAIALSWQTTGDKMFIKHESHHDIAHFLEYPGREVVRIVKLIIDNDFYGKELVNVNFPMHPSSEYKIVKVSNDITSLWRYPVELDRVMKRAKKPTSGYSDHLETDITTDIGALHKGFITISPLNYLS